MSSSVFGYVDRGGGWAFHPLRATFDQRSQTPKQAASFYVGLRLMRRHLNSPVRLTRRRS